MNNYILNQHVSFKNVARIIIVLIIVGMVIYGFEHFGGRYMSRLSAFVAEQGSFGPIAFMAVNAVATMFLVPQSVFTVAAGALFGWKMGAVWASIAMTGGASGAFLVARYGVRDWLGARFKEHVVFRKMQHLSQTHPLQVISLSRLIPVVPFPLASYLLGVTRVRSVPYVFLTWLCMLPETLFLASGGHLLHVGISQGHVSWEAVALIVVAGVSLVVLVHRLKARFLDNANRN